MNGIHRIAAERERQKHAEGWTAQHDDEHDSGELAFAAACYTEFAGESDAHRDAHRSEPPRQWPWSRAWWKPSPGNTEADRMRELEKAGALIAAELDRVLRAHARNRARASA